MTRAQFQRLSDIRIREARTLLDAKEWSGAYYLAGYAVECALKACVIVSIERNPGRVFEKDFPKNCRIHNLEQLIGLAFLQDDHKKILKNSADFLGNWGVVKDWNELSRYVEKSEVQAMDLYHAITDPTNGVLPWITIYW